MGKTDRFARMHRLERLLLGNPDGMRAVEIAERLGVSKRTVYRDIETLSSEASVPIWQEKGRYGLEDGHYLPAIRFTLLEAVSIFLASRLMLRYANRYDPTIASAFDKLNAVVRQPLRGHVEATLEWMTRLRTHEHQRTLRVLADAWMNRRTVKILYHTLSEESPSERLIDPYFIEPAGAGHSAYVVGHCHRACERRTFKIERIVEIDETSETYEIPPDFDANALLSPSMGIGTGGEIETVKLRLDPGVVRIFEEVVWHPSQTVVRRDDGAAIMTLTVFTNVELCSWILGWGEHVEVLEPGWLRMEIAATARDILGVYKQLPLFVPD